MMLRCRIDISELACINSLNNEHNEQGHNGCVLVRSHSAVRRRQCWPDAASGSQLATCRLVVKKVLLLQGYWPTDRWLENSQGLLACKCLHVIIKSTARAVEASHIPAGN